MIHARRRFKTRFYVNIGGEIYLGNSGLKGLLNSKGTAL